MSEPEPLIPQHIMETLFRGLVWCGAQITDEQRDEAWRWLESHNGYEWMGR